MQNDYHGQLLKSFLAVSFYMCVSIGLVFLNRVILTYNAEKTGALFMSLYQFIIAYFFILLISTFCQKVPVLNLFPRIDYQIAKFVKVFPVSITYLFMIGFNNKCLENVSVSGYQIVRSLSVLFNIILSYLLMKEKTSLKACFACFGVVIGFGLGVEGEIGLTMKGAFFGIISSFFVALYAIMVKNAIVLLDNNEYLLIEYNTPIAILILIPVVWYSGEFDILKKNNSYQFWFFQTLGGVIGFIINIAIFLNIKYTTPLTHNLAGIVKACLQTFLAFLIFDNEVMTFNKFLGTVLVIGFSAYYAMVRKNEMKVQSKESQKISLEESEIFPQAQESFDDHSEEEWGEDIPESE